MPDAAQRALAAVAAVLSLPLVAVLAVLIMLDSRGGPMHMADRVGARGRPLRLYKLRTMERAAWTGPRISTWADPRVTRLGRALRRTRLDELPQLWNVVKGEMRLVGPRPEDPAFVDFDDPLHRLVFRAKPGLTGPTQLAFAGEAELLDPTDPEKDYRARILPAKVMLDARYLVSRSTSLDLWILGQTVLTAAGRAPSRASIEARLGRAQA